MSPKARKEVLDFARTDPEPLRSALSDLSHQEGWMNLTPGVPSDAIVEESSLFSWLSGLGPKLLQWQHGCLPLVDLRNPAFSASSMPGVGFTLME